MKQYIYPALILSLLIALCFSVERCRFNVKNAESNFSALSDTVTYFKNSLGKTSASVKTAQLQRSQLKEIILTKDKELAALTRQFSHVNAITKYTQVVTHDTINVTYTDTAPCLFSRKGFVRNAWYSFNYTANSRGFTIDSLTIPTRTTVITGFKRKWFLGKEILVTDVNNSNPNIAVTTLQSVTITVPVPVYKKWYVWLGAGIAGGFLISR